jgi:serine/threonine protein kinase/predicted Zn-dependent protease
MNVIGQNFGHYRLLSLLGKGGMGEVYLGEDTRLSRKVAVKLLPAEFTTDAGCVRRFALEARAVSALNHPNIITIHEIGQVAAQDGGAHYIVTEYVAGEPLRGRMASAPHGRFEPAEAIAIALQIAAALAAAHEAGITHRDIKPENVMLRRDGIVKVLDFGLAKLTEAAPPVPSLLVDSHDSTLVRDNSTEAGVVMGTPRYMSPEQARGEKADARSDLFSLGVMMYEMIAGHAPFTGATTSDVIAAILKDEVRPLTSYAPDTPPEFERIVGKALRKNRTERYQTANDLLTDLKQLQRDLEFASEGKKRSDARGTEPGAVATGLDSNSARSTNTPVAPAPGSVPHSRRAIIIAVATLVVAAIVGWFYFHRPPALTEKDTILLADFENKTGDTIFDGTLKQRLAMELQQSSFLNLFPEAQARQTLRMMGRSAEERMTAEAAQEVCERHDLKALIAGSIAPLGSHYVITLKVISGQSGESLAIQQVEAESREQVLLALSQATTQLRKKLGESLSSIQQLDRPLEQATTANLEAFKAWSVGIGHSYGGRVLESIPFYKRAVELDPDFAQAWSVLAVVYGSTGQVGLAAEAAEKGYALRGRVGEYERLRIDNFYHAFATGNLDKQIGVLTLLKRIYPRQAAGAADLARTYGLLGLYEQALTEGREAIRINPNFAPSHIHLVRNLVRLNRFAEARESLSQAFQQKFDGTFFHTHLYEMAFISKDAAEMQRQLDWMKGKLDEYVALNWQAGGAAYAGQWRLARDFSHRAIELSPRGDTKEVAAQYATEQALRGAVFGACRAVKTDATQGLMLARGRASLPRAALALALCGETNQAKPLVDELTKRYPEDTVINSLWLPTIHAAIDLQHGAATQAIEHLQSTSRYEAAAEFWPQYLRGQAYLKLGRGAESAAEFQKILDHRGYAPLSPLYTLAQLGAARAALLYGDTAMGRKAYEDFFAVWKEADADLPILRTAKREYER